MMLQKRDYQRLLTISIIVLFVAIASGSAVRAVSGGAACSTWPLCNPTVADQPLAWTALAHRLVVLLAGGLTMLSGLAAWFRRDTDPLTRIPALVAPLLLVLQVALGGLMVRLGWYNVAGISHLALALLVLGCLLVPWVALDAPAAQASQRLGARAKRHAQRYRLLAWGAAGACGVLVLATSGRLDACSELPCTNLQLSGIATPWSADIGGALFVASLLGGGLFWQTLRSRRNDRLLLSVALVAGGLFVAQAFLLIQSVALPLLSVGLGVLLWSAVLVWAVLATRRPVTLPVSRIIAQPGVVAAKPSLVNDYISLTKPKVISLLLVTTLAAMFITDGGMPSLALVFWTMLGGYLAAGGAGALNCAFDNDIDINMGRTSRRPVPSGRIAPRNALLFGLLLSALSIVILLTFTTPLATIFATLGIVYYAVFYTRWLKRSTWQNIVIGGGAGSLPPLVGWTAVTGTLTLPAVLLFVIVFYWTPPHFWALALVKQQDYTRAGVPMLPVVAGVPETRWQIWLYSVLLVGFSVLLVPLGAMGWIYFVAAVVLGGLFLRSAWGVWRVGEQVHIWGLYKYSLLYLALLFVAMVVDRLVL